MRRLDRAFFLRDTPAVARDLLGKVLVVRGLAGEVVETEAYHGLDDGASHAAKGQPRARLMLGEPGRIYVYISYGLHRCMNVIAMPAGAPGGILLRAVLPLVGTETMRERRGGVPGAIIADGPGRLCQALAVTMDDYDRDALESDEIFFLDIGTKPAVVEATPRVGITKNVDALWRYVIPRKARRLPPPDRMAELESFLRDAPRAPRRRAPGRGAPPGRRG